MTTAPFGTWRSPVSTALITAGTVALSAPRLDGEDLYWLEGRPDQGGRISLWRTSGDDAPTEDAPTEVTPAPFYVRSRVHEYGGGAYAVSGGTVVFSNDGDGRLYRVVDGDAPTPISPPGPYRFGDLRLHPEAGLVLAVREDHGGPGEPASTIVALVLDGPNPAFGRVLCGGADFYATPELHPIRRRLAWTQWNHPDMPWDATSIMVGDLRDGVVASVERVAGGEESAVQPRWLPSGDLLFVSDRTDWLNLYVWSGGSVRPVCQREAEFAPPQWLLGGSPYVVLGDDRVLCTWHCAGRSAAGLLDLTTGHLSTVLEQGASSGITAGGDRAAAVVTAPDRPARLVSLDLDTGRQTEVRAASTVSLPAGWTSVAREVSWSSARGTVYAWYYPPTSPEVDAPADELPPLIVESHGGPTSCSTDAFDLEIQYWTSRGFAVLDVNYGGSSTFGRAYRNRLRGGWGIVDVADCAAGAEAMVHQGLADPARLVVRGGSAGGYTTLGALTTTDVFRAGISLYGLADLEAMARDTHKFESRYLDRLVGPYPEAVEVYRERSPVHHVDRLSVPLLLLQGADDAVVPPSQAEAMAAAVRAKGLPVALIIFPGEGHGLRRADSIATAIEAQLDFLGRVFGFQPADDVPAIPIDNLPAQGQ